MNKKIFFTFLLSITIFVNHSIAANTNVSGGSAVLDEIFYYDKGKRVSTGDAVNANEDKSNQLLDNFTQLQKENLDTLKEIIFERLLKQISSEGVTDITLSQKNELTKALLNQIIENNKKEIKFFSSNNRMTAEMIKKTFEKYIVNSSANSFISTQNLKTNYDNSISFSNEKDPIEENTISLIPLSELEKLNLNLNIFKKKLREAEIHFITSYGSQIEGKNIKVFKYHNNSLNWLRLQNETATTENCTNIYNTIGTSSQTCTPVNSHGLFYIENILIPGVAYLNVPREKLSTATNTLDGYTDMPRIPSNIVRPCWTNPINGNTKTFSIASEPTTQETCYNYFNYIKYIIRIKVNIVDGSINLVIKENSNPFSEDTRKYLIATNLAKDLTSADNTHNLDFLSDIYKQVRVGAIDLNSMYNDFFTKYDLKNNILLNDTLKTKIQTLDWKNKILSLKFDIENIALDLQKERMDISTTGDGYKMVEIVSVTDSTQGCPTGYEVINDSGFSTYCFGVCPTGMTRTITQPDICVPEDCPANYRKQGNMCYLNLDYDKLNDKNNIFDYIKIEVKEPGYIPGLISN